MIHVCVFTETTQLLPRYLSWHRTTQTTCTGLFSDIKKFRKSQMGSGTFFTSAKVLYMSLRYVRMIEEEIFFMEEGKTTHNSHTSLEVWGKPFQGLSHLVLNSTLLKQAEPGCFLTF
jgi:hypothetical protein